MEFNSDVQDQVSDLLTTVSRAVIIKQIASLIEERYLEAQIAARMAEQLHTWLEDESADIPLEPDQLAPTITQLLFSICRDQHLRVVYHPGSQNATPEGLIQQHFRMMQGMNYGVIRAERLIGNIGLLELRELPPVDLAGDLLHAAMTFLRYMHAFIIDLRLAEGGSPDMVQLLVSYLVAEEPQPLSGVIWPRRDQQEELWTLQDIPGQRLVDQPVYVLTSGMTHSAAEALAYDLRALKRATLIGERTRGGAHLTSILPLEHGLILHLPEGRAHNPITGDSWEKSPIAPDSVVPQQHALTTAHEMALHHLLETASTAEEKDFFNWEMESLMAVNNPVAVSPRLMAGYGGSYGDWQIAIGDGGLYARHHTTIKLTPISDTDFMLGHSVRLRFVVDKNGDVALMRVIHRDGTISSLPRIG